MKLMNREPTEEMIEAGIKLYSSNGYTGGGIVFQAMYDAAPEIKVDMEPVAKVIDWNKNNVVRRHNSPYLEQHSYLYSAEQVAHALSEQDYEYNRKTNRLIERHAEQVATLQAQLAERDRLLEQREATILEQQAKIKKFIDTLWRCGLIYEANLPALKSALKAERIKTLEDAAGHFADTPKDREVKEELTRMANALKEQS